MKSFTHLIPRRPIPRIEVGLMAVFLIVLAYYVIIPVIAPFTRDAIPARCTFNSSHLPAERNFAIPGVGTGTLVVADGTTAVVAKANYGGSPFIGHAYIIDKQAQRIVQTIDFTGNDFVHAGFDGKGLYLWNDGIGYFTNTASYQPLSFVIQSDNYRRIFTKNGTKYLQSDVTVSGITKDGRFISRHHFKLSSVAYGCFFGQSPE